MMDGANQNGAKALSTGSQDAVNKANDDHWATADIKN